jgi:hypothetical protein
MLLKPRSSSARRSFKHLGSPSRRPHLPEDATVMVGIKDGGGREFIAGYLALVGLMTIGLP